VRNSDGKITLYLLNYNYFEYLQHSVESLLDQSDKDFEVILIDNGSKDASVEYMSAISELHGWSFLQFDNISLGAVGNKILSLASCEYIVRLDADDWLDKNFIKNMKQIIHNESPSLIFGNFYYVDGEDNLVGSHECLDRGYSSDKITHDEPLHGACTLINKSNFKDFGGYYEEFKCQDGFDLYLKLRNQKISLLKKKCFYYRRGHSSLSSDKSRLFDTRIKIVEKRFSEEGVRNPSELILLINDSKSETTSLERSNILKLSCRINAYSNSNSVCIVIGVRDELKDWENDENIQIEQWSESEAMHISSSKLVRRLRENKTFDYISLVNVSGEIVPFPYIVQASKVAVLFNTQGTISGYRFDQSLFRPVCGGVQQVSMEGAVKDLDRWVLHIGGLTCLKYEFIDVNHPLFSLMEVDPTSLLKCSIEK